MTRNNAIVPKKKARKRNKMNDGVGTQPGARGLAVSRPFTSVYSATNPGRASLRTTFEAFPTVRYFELANGGSLGFAGWFPQLESLLSPFVFFRIVNLRFTTQLTGGAASVYTIAANVSNNPLDHDVVATTVLDDDYAGVANAINPLVLTPPSEYWRQGSVAWYPTSGPVTMPTGASQGTLSIIGYGSAEPTTVIGWHTVDIEVEFHTLR